MTDQTPIKAERPSGLTLLRAPFPANQISKLPKPTKAQTEAVRNDFKKGIRCKMCGAWHHPDVVHLDYVGHAALTDRLLECDAMWNWEPIALSQNGTPLIDDNGGMWIRLTVCGVSRLGYGHPDGKRGGDAIKEVIGDALRNAAMRFGAALDLWHKGDLHSTECETESEPVKPAPKHGQRQQKPQDADAEAIQKAKEYLAEADSPDDLKERWERLPKQARSSAEVAATKDATKERLSKRRASDDVDDDETPY